MNRMLRSRRKRLPRILADQFVKDAGQRQTGGFAGEGERRRFGQGGRHVHLQDARLGAVPHQIDLPSDGTPISCPLVQGSGAYTFTVWENTTGQRYSELYSLADQPVTLADEFQPFIRPSVYCDYDASSKSTQLANDLSADAQNEGDVVRGIDPETGADAYPMQRQVFVGVNLTF